MPNSSRSESTSTPTYWNTARAAVAHGVRKVAERYALHPRPDAAAWGSADTPAKIHDLIFRRAGTTGDPRDGVDRTVLAYALSRAPGWTPETLRATLRADFRRHTPGFAMRALALNPALSVPWVQSACAEAQIEPAEGPAWIGDWLHRMTGPTPPIGWSSDPACWRPLLSLCAAASTYAREVNWVRALVADLVHRLTTAPDITDATLGALFTTLTDRQWGGNVEALGNTLPLILTHPVAGAETQAAFCRWIQGIPGTPGWPWRLLLTTRPGWIAEPAVRAVLSERPPAAHNDLWPIFLMHAEPQDAAKAWTHLFAADIPEALAALGTLPTAAIRQLPPFSAHDIQQCLAHAPTTAARLGLIAALGSLPVQEDPPTPPTVAVVPVPPRQTPVPITPAHMSAHNPTLRWWLSQQTPEFASFAAQEADAQREWRRQQNLRSKPLRTTPV